MCGWRGEWKVRSGEHHGNMVRKGKNRERKGDGGERSRRRHSDGGEHGGEEEMEEYVLMLGSRRPQPQTYPISSHTKDPWILSFCWITHGITRWSTTMRGRTSRRSSHKDKSRKTSRHRIQMHSLYTLTPHTHSHSHSHSHSQPHSHPLRWPSARPHAWQTRSSPRGSPSRRRTRTP